MLSDDAVIESPDLNVANKSEFEASLVRSVRVCVCGWVSGCAFMSVCIYVGVIVCV